jgi:DNA topoisomerase IB
MIGSVRRNSLANSHASCTSGDAAATTAFTASSKRRDRRIAKIIRACQELPGQELLQYLDEEGKPCNVTSSDVNAYLKEITGNDITAKDFRTWAGTVLAAMALHEVKSFDTAAQAKRNLRAAIENVAARLGNTPTIRRKCYVHPDVLTSYLDGELVLEIKKAVENGMKFRDFSPKKRPSWLCCADGSCRLMGRRSAYVCR